jgi:hypothetical protein
MAENSERGEKYLSNKKGRRRGKWVEKKARKLTECKERKFTKKQKKRKVA